MKKSYTHLYVSCVSFMLTGILIAASFALDLNIISNLRNLINIHQFNTLNASMTIAILTAAMVGVLSSVIGGTIVTSQACYSQKRHEPPYESRWSCLPPCFKIC